MSSTSSPISVWKPAAGSEADKSHALAGRVVRAVSRSRRAVCVRAAAPERID